MSAVAGPDEIRALITEAQSNLHVDASRSRALAEQACDLATGIGDERLEGLALRARANALWVSGRNPEAVDLHERALAIFERIGDQSEIARTLNASLQPLILLGRYDHALTVGARAREIFISLGDDLRHARVLLNLGNLLHRQDRFDEALASYEEAHARLSELGDAEGVMTALHNEAVTLITLNRFREAFAAYEQARTLCVSQNLPRAAIQADYNIAWLYYLRGEYGRAIDGLRAAAETSRQIDDAYHGALCQLDLSEIYLELNLSEDAHDLGEQAHARFRELGMGYEAAKALANVAIACGQQGKAFRAIELFAEARHAFVAENNYAWPSLIDLYQAALLFEQGRLFEARRLAAAALAFFDASPLQGRAVLCHLMLARIALKLGDARASRGHCEQALARLQDSGATPLQYHARYLLGQAALSLGERSKAYECYRGARDALEALRGSLRGDELKIAFLKDKTEVYGHLVELALERDDLDARRDAFAYIEEAKSRTLLDLVFHPVQRLGHAEAGESELVRSIRDLREELNWYYHVVEQEQLRPGEPAPERVQALNREIGTRERDLARIVRDMPQDIRGFEMQGPGVFGVDDLRAVLPQDGVLVEYFQAGERILACLVTHDDLRIVPVSLASRVANHIRMLQFQFSKFRLGDEYVETFARPLLETTRAHLRELYDELLAPMSPFIDDRHVVIVPHGFLHHVPFHALYDGEQYVIDRCTVSYAPSASVYVLCDRQPPSAARRSLVLGVADANAPQIEAEARRIAQTVPEADLFLGADVTADLLRERGAASRVIHIASHGNFRHDSPMFSGIRLGDGYLNVYDLYHLQLPADLIALTGCATGLNMLGAGDELLGLVRGMLAAGARTLIVSLWDVHDRSAETLAGAFYEGYCGGQSPAAALRDAMRGVRDERPHPYHWAPFLVVGRSAAV
jgi:CHAT domain-containing protein